MKDMKFRVHSPEHSKAIQEKLFELGYEWAMTGYKINSSNMGFVYAREGVMIHGNGSEAYINSPLPETTLDDLYKLKAEVSKGVYEDNQLLRLREMAQDMLDEINKLKED